MSFESMSFRSVKPQDSTRPRGGYHSARPTQTSAERDEQTKEQHLVGASASQDDSGSPILTQRSRGSKTPIRARREDEEEYEQCSQDDDG